MYIKIYWHVVVILLKKMPINIYGYCDSVLSSSAVDLGFKP